MPLVSIDLTLLVLTGSSFFILGAYYQHHDFLSKVHRLIQEDPYAFYIREKLYDTLQLFNPYCLDQLDGSSSRMSQIMKYGFPGLDDIRVYSDFILSYDRRNRVAHWVYEHLRAPCVKSNGNGAHRRESYYQADMSVPSNFRADLTDYRDSRFDRGHLAAAGNHKCHQTHCNETFYLTNIAPQVGKGFNRDAWNNLEIYVRDLTERYGSVYVCTGPIYKPKHQLRGVTDAEHCGKVDDKWCVEYEVIGENTVAVPTHFFKVITVESKLPGGSPYMEAYIMPNAPISSSTNIRNFLADIREIEHIAGLQFFNGLRRSFFFGTNYSTASDIYRNFV
ncbi:PREDICTED: endonuclease G, mitochondrial-like [Rhagoletis zephyria]|uniref:endonuclease G, mitochondrial-like n=1 Tax=Rhagoletis zephyria TaxID=28612 RepID=UPI0008114995|nr:PREDICTED: endonuclease G, mitochondrial-like [Rhagoletis zephyria]